MRFLRETGRPAPCHPSTTFGGPPPHLAMGRQPIGAAMRDGIPDYKAWVRIPITFYNCRKDEPACIDSLE